MITAMVARVVRDGPDLETVRELFREYSQQIGVDLCFQDFAAELAGLPGDYAEPNGTLLLGEKDGAAAGCVAVRRWDADACEMKRLYVRPAFQGSGLGRFLALEAIGWAMTNGYARVLLDTLPSMATAQRLYERLGFVDIRPYRENPIAGARYMALDLTSVQGLG
jgi:ribosomal protein S18 acetylase RimI-like enzyme